MSTINERVARGVELLDEVRPGWWREIDLTALDIGSGCSCIAGQLGTEALEHSYPAFLSPYMAGLDLLGIGQRTAGLYGLEYDLPGLDLSAPGASAAAVERQYEALTAAWRDLIESRRDAEVTG